MSEQADIQPTVGEQLEEDRGFAEGARAAADEQPGTLVDDATADPAEVSDDSRGDATTGG